MFVFGFSKDKIQVVNFRLKIFALYFIFNVKHPSKKAKNQKQEMKSIRRSKYLGRKRNIPIKMHNNLLID